MLDAGGPAMFVKLLVLTLAAFAAYVVFVMIADARDPYGTPDPEDDGAGPHL
jgi:hypothetical protein